MLWGLRDPSPVSKKKEQHVADLFMHACALSIEKKVYLKTSAMDANMH
jgi:hypothetical protein